MTALNVANSGAIENNVADPVLFAPDGDFVVARLFRDGDSLGRAGRSEYVPPGAGVFVPVPFDERIENGDRFVLTLFNDTNGNREFDAADRPYVHSRTAVRANGTIEVMQDVHRDTTTTRTTTTSTTTDPGTSTATDAESGPTTRGDTTTTSGTTVTTDQPGFTTVVAVVAVLAAGLLADRRA